ncbi:MAG TPA: SCP2 sterol-binding domain-containing protein [Actinomycetota bacterium]|nr:SCP2 sterol-binding domain-containing protein [Actinomycetota bacterium]
MGVKFLSEEWVRAVQDALNGSQPFRAAAGTQMVRLQQVVTGGPQGDVKYWLRLENGQVTMGVGELGEPPDATVTQDYETAAAISRAELSPVAAYMSGKLRVSGDLMKLMQLQGALGQMPAALKDLDVEY